ncbi:hypothetical protein C5B94_09925 [Clavibacter michiganensis]|uniref:hypothetical protein n=1 Tax=Clavibacter michiganensis TaxID=28447 RepID=UPI000CE7ABA4|nr:hypothetical protein [Clavibacter michiganensis]PPF53359.1 hypothetical protein C5B94_09925 [Clavibacter michiganensis]
MSLEVLLIPLGIAAYAAWREASSTDLCESCKSTRITEQGLLVDALSALGAVRITQAEGRVTGHIGANSFTFQRVGEIFLGRIDGAADTVTLDFLHHLERQVGGIVQARNIETVRVRAAEMGMTLISEVAEDGSVRMIFEEA